MKIVTPTQASYPCYTMICTPLELMIVRAAVGGLAEIMAQNPDMFSNERMQLLLTKAKEMTADLEAVRGGWPNVSVQDETLRTSSERDQIPVPEVAHQSRGSAVVRATGREDQDVD